MNDSRLPWLCAQSTTWRPGAGRRVGVSAARRRRLVEVPGDPLLDVLARRAASRPAGRTGAPTWARTRSRPTARSRCAGSPRRRAPCGRGTAAPAARPVSAQRAEPHDEPDAGSSTVTGWVSQVSPPGQHPQVVVRQSCGSSSHPVAADKIQPTIEKIVRTSTRQFFSRAAHTAEAMCLIHRGGTRRPSARGSRHRARACRTRRRLDSRTMPTTRQRRPARRASGPRRTRSRVVSSGACTESLIGPESRRRSHAERADVADADEHAERGEQRGRPSRSRTVRTAGCPVRAARPRVRPTRAGRS